MGSKGSISENCLAKRLKAVYLKDKLPSIRLQYRDIHGISLERFPHSKVLTECMLTPRLMDQA